MSTRPEDGQTEGEADLWVMDREAEGRLERFDMFRLHNGPGHGGTDIWWVDVVLLEGLE